MSDSVDKALTAANDLFDALHRGNWSQAASHVATSACRDPRRVDVARFVLLDGVWSLDIAAQRYDIIDNSWFMMVIDDDSFYRDSAAGSGAADV